MKRFLLLGVVLCVFSGAAIAQKKWTDWDKKEVEKMLNESAWGQTQTVTDTSQMVFFSSMNDSISNTREHQAVTLNYRIRFFSAKPIREAFARQLMLGNPNLKAVQLERFINGDYSESIVVGVTFDGADL